MRSEASSERPDFHRDGFPHSDIYGLTLARQLPVAYRSRAASFIASLESRHPPYALKFPIRKFVNHFCLILLHEINHITIYFLPVNPAVIFGVKFLIDKI